MSPTPKKENEDLLIKETVERAFQAMQLHEDMEPGEAGSSAAALAFEEALKKASARQNRKKRTKPASGEVHRD